MRKFLLFIYTFILTVPMFGQDVEPKFKFGELNPGELEMTVCHNDSDANAVVLCNYRHVTYETREVFTVIYTNHIRIKVLKDEGVNLANVSIAYLDDGNAGFNKERLSNIRAYAFNMENSKVVKTKMDREFIFNERVNDKIMITKFTIPQVKAGTVLEYEYTLTSGLYGKVNEWLAQSNIPTFFAKYVLEIPQWFHFGIETKGQKWLSPKKEPINMNFNVMGNNILASGERYTFTGRNIPAVRSSKYVWNLKDYMAKVSAEISGLEFPGQLYKNFSMQWGNIDRWLIENENFCKRMKEQSPFVNELKEEGIDKLESKEDRAVRALMILHKHVKWNNQLRLLSQPQGKVVKDGVGSSADLNTIYINMLHDVGLDAVPVVMSSRDNGALPENHPSLESLNTFIVGIPTGDNNMLFLDATTPFGFFNIFSEKLYSDKARIIDNIPRWVNLQNIAQGSYNARVNVDVHTDGTMTGSITNVLRGNEAFNMKKDFYSSADSTTFMKIRASKSGLEIRNYTSEDVRAFSNKTVEKYEFKKDGEITADHIYISAFPLKPFETNPLTENSRSVPIEFPFKQNGNIAVSIKIPDGWAVEDMPKTLMLSMPGDSFVAKILTEVKGNIINISFTTKMDTLFYYPEKYDMLKEMFAHLVDRGKDMIVLKKL